MSSLSNSDGSNQEDYKDEDNNFSTSSILLQRFRNAVKYLNMPIELANCEPELRYNMPIQIESMYKKSDASDNSEEKFVLAVLMMDGQIKLQRKPRITETSAVSVTAIHSPSRRNVFKCVNIWDKSTDTPVLYGKDFYICLFDIDGRTLYLVGLVPHLNYFGKTGGKIPLALNKNPDNLCRFRVIHPNPERMNALQGTPVKTFEGVYIAHSFSKILLAVDLNTTINTSHCVDFETHCYTYNDTSMNSWKFVTQTNEEDSGAD